MQEADLSSCDFDWARASLTLGLVDLLLSSSGHPFTEVSSRAAEVADQFRVLLARQESGAFTAARQNERGLPHVPPDHVRVGM